MDKYFWSYDKDAGIWDNAANTIEECLKQAQEFDSTATKVYIGESIKDVSGGVEVNLCALLDTYEQDVCDYFGEVADDYEAGNFKKVDEIEELQDKINKAFFEWQKKYGYEQHFCRIENIQLYDLQGVE